MRKPLALISIVSLVFLAACSKVPEAPKEQPEQQTMEMSRRLASTKSFLSGKVSSWVTLNTDKSVQEVGFNLPLEIIENAPTSLPAGADPEMMDPASTTDLSLAGSGTATTFVDHIELNYNPIGHPPQAYAVPHLDIHFYGIPLTEELAIDCSDTTLVLADRLPPKYMLGKVGPPPNGDCVPQMGLHAVDLSSPELSNSEPFSKTMILGYYGGNLIFIEPMITREELLKKQSFTMKIPAPEVIGKSVLYPQTFTAAYDQTQKIYHMALTDFVRTQK